MRVKKWKKHQVIKCLCGRLLYQAIILAIICISSVGFMINVIQPDCKMIQYPNEYFKSLKSAECGLSLPIIELHTSITFTFSVAIAQTPVSSINLDIRSDKKQIEELFLRHNPKSMQQG